MTALRRWLWASAAAARHPVGAWPCRLARKRARPMTLVDIAELQRLLAPRLSPDGRTLAYMLTKADWKAGRPIWHLWRQDVDGAPVQLTFSEGGDIPAPRSVRWSPDGKTILFLRAGQISADPRRWRRAASPHPSRHRRRRRRCGRRMARPSISSPAIRRPAEERERDRLRDDVYAFEENYKPQQLWKVIVATGAEQQLTTGEIVGPRVPALARRLEGRDAPRARRRSSATAIRGEVWVMDVDGRQRPRPHAKRRFRENGGGALARQQPGAVPRRHQRAVRAVLQHAICSSCPRRAARRSRCCPISSTRSTTPPGRPTASRSSPSSTWACTARSSRSTSRRIARVS